jgi:hypothetical protein
MRIRMKILKAFFIFSFTLLIGNLSLLGQQTEFAKITEAIKSADSKTIYSLCENSINLSTPGTYGKFSKTQSRKILDQFFNKQPADEVKEVKTEKVEDYYMILDYQSRNQTYSIFIQLNKVDSKFLIQKIQIQEAKK